MFHVDWNQPDDSAVSLGDSLTVFSIETKSADLHQRRFLKWTIIMFIIFNFS